MKACLKARISKVNLICANINTQEECNDNVTELSDQQTVDGTKTFDQNRLQAQRTSSGIKTLRFKTQNASVHLNKVL